jgi:DNA-binding NarL/FixJ family response regulator
VSNGYFLRRTPPAQVLAPMAGASLGKTHSPDHVLLQTRSYFQNLIAGPPAHRPTGEQPGLTPREEEILLRLSKGYQDKQIADTLNISTWTVHNHIKNIFKKLGVHSRTQAVIKHLQK